MAKPSETAKHAYTYIPPSVQKTMSEHMERNMPAHLNKYQQGSGYIPPSVQKSMADHMQKTMPGHLKKYVDPYLDQHVINPRGSRSDQPAAPSPLRPIGRAAKVRGLSSHTRDNDLFVPDQPQQAQPSGTSGGGQQPPASNDPYGFIMNPGKPPSQPLFNLGGSSMLQKILVIAGGFIGIIILFVFASSLLNGASNAQKDRLLKLAQTQSEIVSVVDNASEKLSDKNLLYKASTVKIMVESSQQDVIAAMAKRGKKVKDKDLQIENPADSAALSEGEQNGRFDEAYDELLNKQLAGYRSLLKEVYDAGNDAEKGFVVTANDQLKLLVNPADQ